MDDLFEGTIVVFLWGSGNSGICAFPVAALKAAPSAFSLPSKSTCAGTQQFFLFYLVLSLVYSIGGCLLLLSGLRIRSLFL